MLEVRERTYLLIQDGIIDGAPSPYQLFRTYHPDFDTEAGFKVAIGCVNEFGEREVVGIIADVAPLRGARTWVISSRADGYGRLVGATGAPEVVVSNRLHCMYVSGDFDDLANLPATMTITPGEAPAPVRPWKMIQTP